MLVHEVVAKHARPTGHRALCRPQRFQPRPKAGPPLIVIPTVPSGTIVLEAAQARPEKRRANEATVGKKNQI